MPHKEPLIFAKEVLNKQDNIVDVHCIFKDIPTLAMFVEAAAQASSAFDVNNDIKPKIGFLTVSKDVKLLKDIKKKGYVIKVEIKAEINNIKQFYFEVFEELYDAKCVSGYFTIIIQE